MKIIRNRSSDRFTSKMIAEGHRFGMTPQPQISHKPGEPIQAQIAITTTGLEEDGKTSYDLVMTPEEAVKLGQSLLDSGIKLRRQHERSIAAGKIVDD